MVAKSKKNIFSSIKTRISENKITFLNASVMIGLIIIVIIVLLNRSSALQRQTAEESLVNLAGMTAYDIQAYIISQMDSARNITQPMMYFETINVEQRRSQFNEAMQLGINTTRPFMNVFTVWGPNALDDMDAQFVNTDGHDETGHFIGGYTRERGWIEQRAFPDYRFLLEENFRSHWGYGVETISPAREGLVIDPSVQDYTWRFEREETQMDIWVVDIYIPILRGGAITGVDFVPAEGIFGATVNLTHLQNICESVRPYETGRLFITSNDGTIVAHRDPRRRGTRLFEENVSGLPFSDEVIIQLQATIRESLQDMRPVVLRTRDDLIVSYPFRTTSTMTSTMTYNAVNTPPWAVVTIVPMSTVLATINTLLRFSILFIIGAATLTGFVLFISSRSLTQQAKRLQQNLEQASTMQDNLRYGLFLMDEKYIIQGAYSKALERILTVPNLQDKNFIDLISGSIKLSQKQGVEDYLEMVFKDAYDKEMLENINPIQTFTYVSLESGEKKELRTTFALAEHGRGAALILGTVEDITAEKELAMQLAEVESQRENEMRALFQVIQLDPKVLSDFVADADYEFERINDMLKDKSQLQQNVLVEMYQSIHAIKSNALILNLEDFSERLHQLESSIKELQDRNAETVAFDDFLGLVLQLNDAMREMDQLQATVSKIENFRNISGGDDTHQERYVLVETLSRVCMKTQTALGKKVKFTVDAIDESILDYAPRRIIKDILTQLVRNAVYHGIESPEEREAVGKKPEGEIRLSISYKNNSVTLKLTDNGSGIDFSKIRKTAIAANIVRNSSDANDKGYLLKALFSPGFSTLGKADLHAGRGVGLSLVRDHIKGLNGSISVTTSSGKGTTFIIVIPLELPAVDDKVS